MANAGPAKSQSVRPRTQTFRRPTQERGRRKFESILDATEELLETREPYEISIYDIAEKLTASPPSVYHFFQDASLVYVALAERFIEQLADNFVDRDIQVGQWIELIDAQFQRVFDIYQERPAVRKIMLGAGYSVDVRQSDWAAYPMYARMLIDLIDHQFVLPDFPNIADRFIEAMAITDAMWALNFQEDGPLSARVPDNARRARNAYLRIFLPEELPRRVVDQAVGARGGQVAGRIGRHTRPSRGGA